MRGFVLNRLNLGLIEIFVLYLKCNNLDLCYSVGKMDERC
jgi:hypothetical protein